MENFRKNNRVYEMAKEKMAPYISDTKKVEIIFNTIKDIMQNYDKQTQYKILGEDAFLDYISYKKKLKSGNIDIFEKDLKRIYGNINKKDLEKIVKAKFNIGRDSEIENVLLVKIMQDYFPLRNFEKLTDDDYEEYE